MEPAQEQIAYVFKSRIVDVTNEKRIRLTTTKGLDGKFITEDQDLGWFILLEGSHEKLFVGFDKPHFIPWDVVRVTIMRDGANAGPA